LLAVISFAVASLSDGLDGYIARRYNQRSELGALLDPVADKLLLISAVILLGGPTEGYLPRFPLWYTGTVLGRDVVIVIGVAVLHYMSIRVRVRPVWYGKVATVGQMACILWALLKWPAAPLPWMLGATAVLTGVAGIRYLADGVRQAGASPSSGPQES
jgi:CDP-diacylglycerol--glycerol-3-phosphate 3-phosphatidyltransferase